LAELLAKTRVFALPQAQDNADGWGPTDGVEEFQGIPFAPFNKADKIGRVADGKNANRYYNRNRSFGSGSTGVFNYSHDLEESSFNVVDNTPRFKPRDGRRRFAKFSIHNKRRRGRGFKPRWNNNRWDRRKNNKGKRNNYRRRWNQFPQEAKEPSIPIQVEWELVNSVDIADLGKKAVSRVPAGTNLVECGKLEQYSRAADRIAPRTPVDLARFESREFITATTSEDPVLQRLQANNRGTVYGTDTILAVLMIASRSVDPWDIVVNKKEGVIVFDKRPNSRLDFLSVNENWNEVQETDLKSPNHPLNLSQEATLINHNFSQHVLDSKQPGIQLDDPNPFANQFPDSELASMGYLYRRWRLSADTILVARCEVNAFTRGSDGKNRYITTKALNEFDYTQSGGIEWRTQLDSQSAAVLAQEMKNNGCKLAKWTAKAVLAGSDEFRLGFVTRRANLDGSNRHEILMVKNYKLDTFVQQTQQRSDTLFGSLVSIIEMIQEQEDGQFILMRDPNEAQLLLYSVPAGHIPETKPVPQ